MTDRSEIPEHYLCGFYYAYVDRQEAWGKFARAVGDLRAWNPNVVRPLLDSAGAMIAPDDDMFLVRLGEFETIIQTIQAPHSLIGRLGKRIIATGNMLGILKLQLAPNADYLRPLFPEAANDQQLANAVKVVLDEQSHRRPDYAPRMEARNRQRQQNPQWFDSNGEPLHEPRGGKAR